MPTDLSKLRASVADSPRAAPFAMDRLYAQLVRDALDVLDRYRAPIGKRDPVKSLDEDREELLGRVRAALERLISPAPSGRDNVIEIVRRIDEFLRGQAAQDTLEQARLGPRRRSYGHAAETRTRR